jgi:meso-butanediol dehydrogenase/(S,S)-butanediol dehydrogenase/diacetyl reductase
VTDRTSVREAIDPCRQKFGSIKVMVNNAGSNKPEPFLEASEAVWHKIMDVNALGVMIGIQEAAKAMIAAGTKGKIVNPASIAGRTGYADFARYCARKFAGVAFTQAVLIPQQSLRSPHAWPISTDHASGPPTYGAKH